MEGSSSRASSSKVAALAPALDARHALARLRRISLPAPPSVRHDEHGQLGQDDESTSAYRTSVDEERVRRWAGEKRQLARQLAREGGQSVTTVRGRRESSPAAVAGSARRALPSHAIHAQEQSISQQPTRPALVRRSARPSVLTTGSAQAPSLVHAAAAARRRAASPIKSPRHDSPDSTASMASAATSRSRPTSLAVPASPSISQADEPGSDTLAGDEKTRKEAQDRRWRAARELRDTERTYVTQLDEIHEVRILPLPLNYASWLTYRSQWFYQPLLSGKAASGSQDGSFDEWWPALSRRALSEVFSNFADVRALAHAVLDSLELCVNDAQSPLQPPKTKPIDVVEQKGGSAALATPPLSTSASSEEHSCDSAPRTPPFLPAASSHTKLAFPSASPSPKRPHAQPQTAPFDLGAKLLPLLPFLKAYSLFVANFDASLAKIAALDQAAASSGAPTPTSSAVGSASGGSASLSATEGTGMSAAERDAYAWSRVCARASANNIGRGLSLGSLLLAIVLRIPRIRLLLADVVRHTPTSHKDYKPLCDALKLTEHVALHLERQIALQTNMCAVVELERALTGTHQEAPSTPSPSTEAPRESPKNAPRLVAPGRTLLKCGVLRKRDRHGDTYDRIVLLFNDALVHASPAGAGVSSQSSFARTDWRLADWARGIEAAMRGGGGAATVGLDDSIFIPTQQTEQTWPAASSPLRGLSLASISSVVFASSSSSRRAGGGSASRTTLDAYTLYGLIELERLTVVGVDMVSRAEEGDHQHAFEVLSPDKSFVLHAPTRECRDKWVHSIREAQALLIQQRRTLRREADDQQLRAVEGRRISLHERRRDRQLSLESGSSLSTSTTAGSFLQLPPSVSHHARASTPPKLGFIPPTPSDEVDDGVLSAFPAPMAQASTTPDAEPEQRQLESSYRVVENYSAPVWVPNTRADRCMGPCAEAFTLWRRRHHCRLCGGVVCWACSTRVSAIKLVAGLRADTLHAVVCNSFDGSWHAPSACSSLRRVLRVHPRGLVQRGRGRWRRHQQWRKLTTLTAPRRDRGRSQAHSKHAFELVSPSNSRLVRVRRRLCAPRGRS